MEIKKDFRLDVVSVRLVRDAPIYSEKKINGPEDAVRLLGEELRDMDREVTCLVSLRTDGTPINCNFVSIGTLNYSLVHPRELFKAAVLSNAQGILLVHNHISGNLAPSAEDILLTDRLNRLCVMMGIPLHDHVIVGGDNLQYYSFRENSMIKQAEIHYATDPGQIEWNCGRVAEKGRCR